MSIERNGMLVQQTPAHDQHNPDLLQLIPVGSNRVIEIGCSSGALAREFKRLNRNCNYFGVDVDSSYVELASRYCDQVCVGDIETFGADFFDKQQSRDCWVFGDSLEHLRSPWAVLKAIRKVIPASGCVVACIPNSQHWSMFARLAIGDLRYEDSGLFDRTHLRWFSRQTLVELFQSAGFAIVEGSPRIFDEPGRDAFLPKIADLALLAGGDPRIAVNDAIPLQYVVRAVPS